MSLSPSHSTSLSDTICHPAVSYVTNYDDEQKQNKNRRFSGRAYSMASNEVDSSPVEKTDLTTLPGCIFCKIASGNDPTTEIVFQNDRVCIFKDIRPASDFHFLAVPKYHVENVKSLTAADKPLLQELKQELVNVLRGKQINLADASFGFHIPPFTSVKHLHMHVIAPIANMGLISRLIFRPNSMWFKTDDTILQSLSSDAPANL